LRHVHNMCVMHESLFLLRTPATVDDTIDDMPGPRGHEATFEPTHILVLSLALALSIHNKQALN
jgi:hypothetical protein